VRPGHDLHAAQRRAPRSDPGAPRIGGAPRRTHGRFLVAAVALLVALVVSVAAIAPARDAVADFLRIGSTRIDRAPLGAAPTTSAPGSALPALIDGLTRLEPASARARLGRSLPDTTHTALGSPDAIYAATSPTEGVILAWSSPATTLWVRPAPFDSAIIYAKQLGGQNTFEVLTGLGDSAIAITGPHTLRTPDRTVSASNVVLWLRDGWEFRLEGDTPITELTAIARATRA
jgi:hypothetical protein